MGRITQPLANPWGNSMSSVSAKKSLIAAACILGTFHIYKRYIEPQFKIKNIITESMNYEEAPEVLGKALADAVANNPFVKENGFYWGVSSSCSQNESESQKSTVSKEYIDNSDKKETWLALGNGCLSDQYWKNDNEKVQALNCNMYRFSIDWSRIQPAEKSINIHELERYAAQCQDLMARGITPMVCFHHYADPIWFIEKGGFEKEENIQYFVDFCGLVTEKLSEKGVTYWLVMNQPLAYINKGYLEGSQPPFKKATITAQAILTGRAMELADKVRVNIFTAHVEVSKAIKNLNQNHQIGASHQITPMRAGRYWSIDPVAAHIIDQFYNQKFLNFAKKEKKYLDFIALSSYSPCRFTLFDIGISPFKFKWASMNAFWNSEVQGYETDDEKRIIDPQGLFDSVKRIAENVGKEMPIIIIESGVDVQDEKKRINYFNQTMSAIVETLKAGYHLKGFCVWTLMDNYEWGKGYNAHFGLYTRRVFDDSGALIDGELKDGGKHYKNIIASFNTARNSPTK
jgi:beta-glucosidase